MTGKSTWRLTPLIIIVLAFACCLFPSAQTSERIAFIANLDGERDIYLVNPEGGNLTRLTNSPADETGLRWSPDGTRILFMAGERNKCGLFAINADGTGLVTLAEETADYYTSHAWSPDGRKVLYLRHDGFSEELYVVDADGANRVRLAENKEKPRAPSWSPDGSRILLALDENIFVVGPDGSNRVQLTDKASCGIPAWSPDGKRIAYFAGYLLDVLSIKSGLYVMAADGSSPEKLFRCDNGRLPVWSPDGRAIAFITKTGEQKDSKGYVRNEYFGMHVIRTDGKKTKTYNCHKESYCLWSPDGTKMAYGSLLGLTVIQIDGQDKHLNLPGAGLASWSPDGTRLCYIKMLSMLKSCLGVMNADGTGKADLTDNQHHVYEAAWSPR